MSRGWLMWYKCPAAAHDGLFYNVKENYGYTKLPLPRKQLLSDRKMPNLLFNFM